MELTSGSSLSRYRLGEKLGAGRMGVVYRAFDTRLERPVAPLLVADRLGRQQLADAPHHASPQESCVSAHHGP